LKTTGPEMLIGQIIFAVFAKKIKKFNKHFLKPKVQFEKGKR
jgi:hypothetical protein